MKVHDCGLLRFAIWLFVPVVLLYPIAGCSGGGSTSTQPTRTLTSITVSTSTSSVAAGLTAQFKATGAYSDSSSGDITSSVTWTSGTLGVATISSSGLATTKAQGTSVITATSGSVSGSSTLTVSAATLSSIAVSAATLQLGSTAQLQATGTYTDQTTQDVSGSVTWSSANNYVASVSASGVVTSAGAGISAVTASQGSLQASGNVTVLASPRFLYVAGLAGRTLTRMAVDSSTGQPRFEGYSTSTITGNIGFPCMTVDPSGTYAYLTAQLMSPGGSGFAGTVAIFAIDHTTGTLTPLPGSPFPVSFALGCLRIAASGNFAYASSGIENAGDQLGTFTVNANGTLTLQNTVSFPFFPTAVVVDPRERFVYVDVVDVLGGTLGSSQIYGYQINQDSGALTALNGSPWAIDAGVYGLLSFHPSGNYLYTSNLNNTEVIEYTLGADGTPTKAGSVDSTCINPSALQFLPDGSHAYGLCGESGGRSVTNAPIVEFAVGSGGQLTVHSTAFAGAVAQQMQVDEAAKFLYVLGSGSDSVSAGTGSTYAPSNTVLAYQIQPDGSLKLAQQVAGHVLAESMLLVSGPNPVKWTTTSAYVASQGDNRITAYAIAADGALTAGASIATGANPFSASTLPWGSDLVFATGTSAPNLHGASADLSAGSSFGAGASTGGIVMEPTGQWAYATDPAGGVVDAFYNVSPGSWSGPTPAPGGPFNLPAGGGDGPITMDPSGRYIVVANQAARSISLFEPLGAAPTPDTPLTYKPLTVAVDGTGNYVLIAGDDAKLHLLRSDGLGTLTEQATGTLAGADTVSVAVDPLSRFVYAAGPAGLNAFSLDTAAGTLMPLSLQTPISLAGATGVFVDPSGAYVYVAVSSGSTNALYLFTANPDGTLTASSTNPVATPKNASSMVFRATVQ